MCFYCTVRSARLQRCLDLYPCLRHLLFLILLDKTNMDIFSSHVWTDQVVTISRLTGIDWDDKFIDLLFFALLCFDPDMNELTYSSPSFFVMILCTRIASLNEREKTSHCDTTAAWCGGTLPFSIVSLPSHPIELLFSCQPNNGGNFFLTKVNEALNTIERCESATVL